MSLAEKYETLLSLIRNMNCVAVAFSGGVDSAFLLAAAKEALGERVTAITALAPNFPAWESMEAIEVCRKLDIPQITVEFDPLTVPEFSLNAPVRCYACKKSLFATILKRAETEGIATVLEGTNTDDLADYRPGIAALTELGIQSPLRDAGLTKAEIRELSHKMGLPTWDRQSLACLATRIPYGEEITKEKLERVDRAEDALRHMGIRRFRVRSHGDLARIELGEDSDFLRLLSPSARAGVTDAMKNAGFTFVTLDLLGYRTGSMNEALHSENQKESE